MLLLFKIETERVWQNMLCTAAHKIYRTRNNRAQPELWTEIVNACPIIVVAVTRPLSPAGVPNNEDSKFCTADGWIDERWEHVTGTLSKLSG